jgi:glutaredoxin 1
MDKSYDILIYGRPGCPFCTRAVQFAEGTSESNPKFNFEYTDIWKEGITMEHLSECAGKDVRTVPQIFANEKHVGGCDDFERFLIQEDLI